MESILKAIFLLNIALFILHEMDAVRNKEWKMLPILSKLPEQTAYETFCLVHLPLFALIMLMMLSRLLLIQNILYIVLDGFLIAHVVLHFIFSKHKDNTFNNHFSKLLIRVAGLTGMIHLGGLLLLSLGKS